MEIFIAIGAGWILIGIPLASYGIHRRRKQGAAYADASVRWVHTRATVIDARLIERESSDSDGDTSSCYEPHLRYRYCVGDRTLDGQRAALCNTPRFWMPDAAEKWLLAHAPGAEIDLWYDPDRPEDSAALLDKPGLAGAAATVGVGVGFVLLGAAMLIGQT